MDAVIGPLLVVLALVAAFGWCRSVAGRWGGGQGGLVWRAVPWHARLVTAAVLGVPAAMAEATFRSWTGVPTEAADVVTWSGLFALGWLVWWRVRGALGGPPVRS